MLFLGEIVGATGLGAGPLFCRWTLDFNAAKWTVAEGKWSGATQVAKSMVRECG